MRYNKGDKVRIKSLDWYNKNKDKDGTVNLILSSNSKYSFIESMTTLCGKVVTIGCVNKKHYYDILEDNGHYYWTDEMIEGLVEEETECNTALSGHIYTKSNESYWHGTQEKVDEIAAKIDKELSSDNQNVWVLPDGYIFKNENGNIINATKIILEKKKKEYPKTYKGCCDVLSIPPYYNLRYFTHEPGYPEYVKTNQSNQLCSLQDKLNIFGKLLICRNAYWKIAGDEMGLDKPWEPSDSDYITGRYCIFVHQGNIICSTPVEDCPLTFPTEEMRDAFYDNFKDLIEQCKELL